MKPQEDSVLKILTGKPLGRPRRRWEENIRMEFKEIGINTRNWVNWIQDRGYWAALVNAALNLWVLYAIQLVIYKRLGLIYLAPESHQLLHVL